jgi:hypothetical protein
MQVTRYCPHCEGEGEFFTPEKVAKLVEGIPIAASLRADPLVYEDRIAICSTCEALKGTVLCAYCGCFVLFRARPTKGSCPHPLGDKWRASPLPEENCRP